MLSSQVKFSADRQTNGQTDIPVKQYDPIYRCGGIKKKMCCMCILPGAVYQSAPLVIPSLKRSPHSSPSSMAMVE